MSESSSSSSISSTLSAFEIENIKNSALLSTTRLKKSKKESKQKNLSNVTFNEKDTHIPYISIDFEKNTTILKNEEDNFSDILNTKEFIDDQNIDKDLLNVQQINEKSHEEIVENKDDVKEIAFHEPISENIIDKNESNNKKLPKENDINEEKDIPKKENTDHVFVAPTSSLRFSPKESSNLLNKSSNISDKSNISMNSKSQYHSPKDGNVLNNKYSNISEKSDFSTNSKSYHYSPKEGFSLANKNSNVSEKSNVSFNLKQNHSPKDPKGNIPSFSPPMTFNNTEYIQRMLRPDEYQKSPDEKEKLETKKTTTGIKSYTSELSKRSIQSNVSRQSQQIQKASPSYSNISRHSVLSNQSRQSAVSHASKHSVVSNASKKSEISKNSESITSVQSLNLYDKEKGVYIAKYYILKDLYPRMNIQIPDDSYSLDRIKSEYNELYKKVCADRFAGEYRTYMAICFAVIEVVLCKVFKLNATGFTKFHLKRIHQYNESLLLLGENTATESTVRNPFSEIITAGAINTVFFILIKYVGNYLSEDTAEKVIQGILDSINTNVDNNLDIHGLSPDSIGDYVDTFMKIIPDKKENTEKSKKPQMKRPTYKEDD